MIGLLVSSALGADYHAIHVVDATNGEPVPCASLTTTNGVRLTTDVNGNAAFYEVDLMGRDVWFTVERQGFEIPADFFGFHGVVIHADEGGHTRVEMTPTGPPGACDAGDKETRRLTAGVLGASERAEILVTDATTGRGLPLALVDLPSGMEITDNTGAIAYDDPDGLGTDVDAAVSSDGFVDAVAHLDLSPGAVNQVGLSRINLAERLYRTTGEGRWRGASALDLPLPTDATALPGLVMGQDSVCTSLFDGQLLWIWGDTNKASYPLGLFDTAGAFSALPDEIDVSSNVPLDYVVGDDGFARAIAPIADSGATWIGGLATVDAGASLICDYGAFTDLVATERGMAVWDPSAAVFRPLFAFEGQDLLRHPDGPATSLAIDGVDWLLWRNGVRVGATLTSASDPSSYEAYGPLDASGSPIRDASGRVIYGWSATNAPWTDPTARSVLAQDELPDGQIVDAATGDAVVMHNGDVRYDAFRGRYVHVFTQDGGDPSPLGEIWYSEADTPQGPWLWARKILTHRAATFYNPYIHAEFDQDQGETLYFEGTYSWFFSLVAEEDATPRYDYNNLMYRLDLDQSALVLPVAQYGFAGDSSTDGLAAQFYALDRDLDGAVPVWWSDADCRDRELRVGGDAPEDVLFRGVPVGGASPTSLAGLDGDLVDFGRWTDAEGEHFGLLSPETGGEAAVRVWANPSRVVLSSFDGLARTRALAGPDVCAQESAPNAGIDVTLDGGPSVGPGGIAAWAWSDAGVALSGDAAPTLHFSAGLHRVRLEVTAADGSTATDFTLISVLPAESTTPDTGSPADEGPTEVRGAGGCGCASTSGGRWSATVALALLVRRRRRATGRSAASTPSGPREASIRPC